MFENFFDMPAMMLCARLIDIVDKEVSRCKVKWDEIEWNGKQ
jgi:hypothetical protein